MARYKRILLKLSGEAIAKKNPDGSVGEIFDEHIISGITDAVAELIRKGTQVAIVIGAGNIWRGAYGKGLKRARADQMGMLGTMINCLRLEDAFDDVMCILASQLSDVDGDAGFSSKGLPEFFA